AVGPGEHDAGVLRRPGPRRLVAELGPHLAAGTQEDVARLGDVGHRRLAQQVVDAEGRLGPGGRRRRRTLRGGEGAGAQQETEQRPHHSPLRDNPGMTWRTSLAVYPAG